MATRQTSGVLRMRGLYGSHRLALQVRVAVISDIHSNLHALEAVLEAIDAASGPTRSGVSATSSATGRGRTSAAASSRSGRPCAWAETTTSACAATSISTTSRPTRLRRRSGRAACSAEQAAEFLGSLEPAGARPTASQLFHASPRDPVWEYILTDQAALAALEVTSAPVVLVGHSHVPLAVTADRRELDGGHAPAERRSISASAAGCSTQARSASRATATRGRRGSCSTSMQAARRSGASTTRSPRRRRRSWRRACRRSWATGSRHGA